MLREGPSEGSFGVRGTAQRSGSWANASELLRSPHNLGYWRRRQVDVISSKLCGSGGITMAEYKASSPTLEIIGGMIVSIWAAFPENFQKMIRGILSKHGVADINPQDWYLLQPALDTLKEIEEKFGHHILSQVGEQAALRAPLPPEIKTFKECMSALNVTIQKMHRGGSPGGYQVEEEKGQGFIRYRVTASTPFPCSLTRGYLESFARRFAPEGVRDIVITHDENLPCRRNGAETCTYVITIWS